MLASAAISFEPRTSLKVSNKTIKGSESLKIVGVTINSDFSFRDHVENIAAKTRAKTWALSKLKKKGLSEQKQIRAYSTLIRPSLEYAAPAWHSLLTAGQAAELEKQQTQALKNIFGPSISAKKMRDKADLETLSKRREDISLRFAKKGLGNPRCSHWFEERRIPVYARQAGVVYPRYKEDAARTDQHRNTPKNYLIRKLNQNQ